MRVQPNSERRVLKGGREKHDDDGFKVQEGGGGVKPLAFAEAGGGNGGTAKGTVRG